MRIHTRRCNRGERERACPMNFNINFNARVFHPSSAMDDVANVFAGKCRRLRQIVG